MSSKRFPEAPGYKIIREIGSGGMGDVFLARNSAGDQVAIKFISGLTVAAIDRFRRETAAMRSIRSRFIVQYLEESFDVDHPFVVYEFAQGESLNEFVERQGPLSERQLHELAIGIADILHGMQLSGIAHRDLKPSNVIITDDGPRVIDFGISAIDGSTPLTTRFVPGTPDWMAPEVRSGTAITTDKIDIYGFGLLIGFAATGLTPDIDAARYRNLNSQAGADLARLVNQCLSLNPTDRPDATTILWKCIGLNPNQGLSFLRGAPTTPQRTVDRRSRKKRVRRFTALIGLVLALMLGSFISALVWSGYDFGKMSISSGPDGETGNSALAATDPSSSTSSTLPASTTTSPTQTLASRSMPIGTTLIRSQDDSGTILYYDSASLPSAIYGELPVLEAIEFLPSAPGEVSANALRSALELQGFTVDSSFLSEGVAVASFRSAGKASCFLLSVSQDSPTNRSVRFGEKSNGKCSQQEIKAWWQW